MKQLKDYLGLDTELETYNLSAAERPLADLETDSRRVGDGSVFLALRGESFDGHDFLDEAAARGAALVIAAADSPAAALFSRLDFSASPFASTAVIVVRDTTEAYCELARRARRAWGGALIAVTGSVGKTSTRNVTAAALSARFEVHRTLQNLNNPIGVSQTLLALPETAEIAVLELGMDHLGEIACSARTVEEDFAVITNIGYSHIERLGSREKIREAKLEILAGLRRGGTLLLSGDDELLASYLCELSPEDPAVEKVGTWIIAASADSPFAGQIAKSMARLFESRKHVDAAALPELVFYLRENVADGETDGQGGEENGPRLRYRIYRGWQSAVISEAEPGRAGADSAEPAERAAYADAAKRPDLAADAFSATFPAELFREQRRGSFAFAHREEHRQQNALIAFAVASEYGLSPEETARGLAAAETEGNRERLEQIGTCRLFHDYYNASAESMKAAFASAASLERDPNKRYVILGGVNELGRYARPLHRDIGRSLFQNFPCPPDHLYLLGEDAAEIGYAYEEAEEAAGGAPSASCLRFPEKETLLRRLTSDFDPDGFYLLKASRGYRLETVADVLADLARQNGAPEERKDQ